MGRPKTYTRELREELVAFAREEIVERGFRGSSLRSITAASGTSTNAIYTLFGSKEALVLEVVRREMASWLALLGAGEDEGVSARDRLISFVVALGFWSVDQPNLYSACFEAGAEVSESLTLRTSDEAVSGDEVLGAAFATRVRDLYEGSGLPGYRVNQIASMLWGFVRGFIEVQMLAGQRATAERDNLTLGEAFTVMLNSVQVGEFTVSSRVAVEALLEPVSGDPDAPLEGQQEIEFERASA